MGSPSWIGPAAIAVAVLSAFPVAIAGLSLPERIFAWRRLADAPRPLATMLLLLPVLTAAWAAMILPDQALPGMLILGWTLLVLAIVDARTFMLPDCLTLPLIAAGILQAILFAILGGGSVLAALVESGMAAAVAYAFMAVIAIAFRRLRGREGLGLGDAKLFAAAGAWLGLPSLPSVLLIGAVSALAITILLARGRPDRTLPLPFGPYLAAGTWITGLYGPIAFG